MKRTLLLTCLLLLVSQVFAQSLAGKWQVYVGADGEELVVSLTSQGSGQAELSLARRFQAVSYGEGSQFWGTFRTTGGYYFMVKGCKEVAVNVIQRDSTLVVMQKGNPAISVTAWLDEAYSTRGLSDHGDYKKQVVAQWKRDFPNNEDVKKYKWIMEQFFIDHYDDAFEVLLEGRYKIVEKTDSSMVLKNLSLAIPLLTWTRLNPPPALTPTMR